jgi:hypothetical protein
MQQPDDLLVVSYSCVHFVPPEEGARARTALAGQGVGLFELDGGAVEDGPGLLTALADAMHFPADTGQQWDAVIDRLTDLSWEPAGSYVLFVRGATALWQRAPEIAGSLVEIWLLVAEEWAARRQPFHLVFLW